MDLNKVTPEPFEIELPKPSPSFKKTLKSILYKIQKYSAYGFMGFVGLHSTSVIFSPSILPMNISQEIFEIARSVYKYKPFETAIIGCSLLHVCSGIGLRFLKTKPKTQRQLVNERSDEVGLGGIASLVGLGSKRSFISQLTNNSLTPLTFSGYCLLPLLIYHIFKFRNSPISVDGDASLLTLQYINTVLNHSPVRLGNILNFSLLAILIYTSSYHFISGILKLNNKLLSYYKKLGYIAISSISILGIISLTRLKTFKFDDGYLLSKYLKYIDIAGV